MDFIEGLSLASRRRQKEKQFLISTRISLLQSGIHGIQFFDQPIPKQAGGENDHSSWVWKTQESIQKLLDAGSSEPASGSAVVTCAPYECQLLLHRPCSRNIAVSESSLLVAVNASIRLIALYLESFSTSGFIVVFEYANRAFQAGMVLLYALRNHATKMEQASLSAISSTTLEDLVRLFGLLSTRWPILVDTAHYIRELVDTNLRNPVGHSGSAYDMNVLEELDCLVTQRRLHSIHHRNISFPPPRQPPSQTGNDPSTGRNEINLGGNADAFLEDENWWRDFINDEFHADHETPKPASESCPGLSESTSRLDTQTATAHDLRSNPRQFRHMPGTNLDGQLDDIIQALPSCSFCRDRRIKCHRQLPSCRECQRSSRECEVFDPVLGQNVPLR